MPSTHAARANMVRCFAHANRYDRRISRAFGGPHARAAADVAAPGLADSRGFQRTQSGARPSTPAGTHQALGRLVIENPA